jgi:hypothetical protein
MKYLGGESESPVVGLFESQRVKRRLVGWCEMAASLGPS